MSEQLTIEILREKFKEAQSKGEDLELIHPNNENLIYCVSAIGKVHALAVCWDGDFEATISGHDIKHWKIKQPKEDYEVLFEHYRTYDSALCLKGMTHKNKDYQFTGRKLLRNKRTGEIVDYNGELLK